jgi:hypothetical protein
MKTLTIKRTFAFIVISLVAVVSNISCSHNHKVSKGNVYQRVSGDIQIGATKSEVMKYLDSLEINGIKAERGDYIRVGYTVTDIHGKEVEVDGTIGAMFKERGLPPDFCNTIGVIFYFDKSEKLITYHIDCFG